jgi:hypothetical protein
MGYQEAVIIGLGNAWSLMSRTVLNSLLRVFPLKPLIASIEGGRQQESGGRDVSDARITR